MLTFRSAKNFDYVKSLGATHTFDYKASDVAEQIKNATNNELSLAYDCIGAVREIIPAAGKKGCHIVSVLGNSIPKELPTNIKANGTFAGFIFNVSGGCLPYASLQS